MLFNVDELFMRRAMDLAMLGTGKVSPNPLVGAAIVYNGKIIGEGWHRQYGEAHAEVNAINSVKERSLLPESTMYVNLEPCSHFGKTPPCADLIIKAKIKKVVIANTDPNPKVAGQGITRLQEHGVEVVTGVLEDDGKALNRYFFTYQEKKRPYIILKWAQTADGFIARRDGDSKWISDRYSRQLVHRLRSETDGIMVGAGTVRQDNPKLNTREWSGRSPLRIVLSTEPLCGQGIEMLSDGEPTVNYHTAGGVPDSDSIGYVKVDADDTLRPVLDDLYSREVLSLLVEGGTHLLQQFIDSELYDEVQVFCSDALFHEGRCAPSFNMGACRTVKGLKDRIFLC